ncbi:histidine kinase [Chitinophaga dinghuensis]|uniref:Histidine kinase n=1 Tax=Chitinophaga dinghuensis TaxID=1539050 RepID=A0A327W4I0_9BACT|nr:histidine kinase [Chitinophaga dinghuensis]RAJ83270.1 histidine kinase [Chitinophaga dinghuensis]
MAKSIYSGTTSRVFIATFSIVFIVYTLLLWQWFDFPFWQSVTDSSVHTLLLASACLLISSNLAYYRPGSSMVQFLYVSVVSCAMTFLWVASSHWILYKTYSSESYYLIWLSKGIPVFCIVGWLIVTGVGFRSIMWYDLEEQRQALQRKEDTEKIVREAELYKLRQQLQPHFLFNSLNSINALIMLRPTQAREMVLKLSDFLRGSIKREDDQWISLTEELQYLGLYLDIEKVRFGHRLTTNVSYEEGAEKMFMPPMLLQPVVENAIKFGLYDTVGEIAINIKAWAGENILYLEVQNPFDTELQQPKKGTGFGLKSIHRRLYLLFARHDLLETSTTENIFTTLIKVPQTHDKSSNN